MDNLLTVRVLKALKLTKITFIKRYAEKLLHKEAVKIVGNLDCLTVRIEFED